MDSVNQMLPRRMPNLLPCLFCCDVLGVSVLNWSESPWGDRHQAPTKNSKRRQSPALGSDDPKRDDLNRRANGVSYAQHCRKSGKVVLGENI